MIISPPFLVSVQGQTLDEAWVHANMPDAPTQNSPGPAGSYPLSYGLAWHNGMHIDALSLAGVNSGQLPGVRAIADGKVVFVNTPTSVSTDPRHPQNYNPWDDSEVPDPRWSDNGCLVIEHKTDIGAHGNTPTDSGSTPTELLYYSVYMHLSALGKTTPAGKGAVARPWQAGDSIWRKDEVGTPGQIYGTGGQIHFEICMNAANLKVLLGREPAWVTPEAIPAPTRDGRADSIYGSVYFYVPRDTPASATQPAAHVRQRSTTAIGTTVWVRMTYGKGACLYETFDEKGRKLGELADPVADFEYRLYAEAEARHKSLSAQDQATSSPSGWYELLRFGRNVGYGSAATDKDPLPATAAHWRRIKSPGGNDLWVDLNDAGVFKFSDADWPAVMGWTCVDDDPTPNDQRCDSNRLKALIADPDPANTQRLETPALARRLADAQVRQKLTKVLASFPCEWERATVEARYGFVREMEGFKQSPQAWSRLQAHLQAMTFDGLPPALLNATWHVHPRSFVVHMRKCLWLSASEIFQMFPQRALRKTGGGNWADEPVNPSWPTLTANLASLNKAARKYCITTRSRLAAFYGNAMQETQWFATLQETGGANTRYAPWYGRGFLQLTWPANYVKYARFRGKSVSTQLESQLATAQKAADRTRSNATLMALESQIPADLGLLRSNSGTSTFGEVSDSAGAYWAWSLASRSADQVAPFVRVVVSTPLGTATYYTHSSFGNVAATVNVGRPSTNYASIYGVQARFQAHVAAVMVLMDLEQFPDAQGQLKDDPEGWSRRS